MIDLGPNWSYEYRIVGPAGVEGERSKHSIARHGKHHLPEISLTEDVAEEVKKEPEVVERVAERQAEEKKKHKRHKDEDKHKKDKVLIIETTPAPTTTTTEAIETFATPRNRHATYSSQSESSSDSSEEKTTAKSLTMFVYDDFTTTKRPKEKKKTKTKEADEPMMEYVVDEDTNKQAQREQVSKPANIVKDLLKNINITLPTLPTMPPTTTTTEVTTHRTGEIYSDPHKVKDDAKINDFTNHIYQQTLKVFDTIKQKTNQNHLRKEVDVLAKSYEEKFREFLSETRHQKIKTRLGTQKVILNMIDNSNRILKRLVNFMIGDLDKRGILRHNVATANIFQKEIDKELALELNHACKKFGICRTGSGFPEFVTDIISIMVRCDDKKFQHAFDSLTEAVKGTHYYHILPRATERKLKSSIEELEKVNIRTVRPMFIILKNMINNKNKPIVVNTVAGNDHVNTSLAFLELVDVLDQHCPQNESNALEWNDIRMSLVEFSENKRFDIQEIMETFIKYMMKTMKSMDKDTQEIVAKNLSIIIGG